MKYQGPYKCSLRMLIYIYFAPDQVWGRTRINLKHLSEKCNRFAET